MKSQDGIIVEREEIEHEVLLEPLDIPDFDYYCETSPIKKADLSLLRRFDIACGEVKYFKPEMVIPKHGIPNLESSLKPKSISPKCCTCIRSHDKNSQKCRWLEEFRREQSQLMTKSINLLEENNDQLTLQSSEGKRSSASTSVDDNMVDSPLLENNHDHKFSTLDVACSQEGLSFFEIDERSTMDDDSSSHLLSSDSSTPCTPISKSQGSPKSSLISNRNSMENFSINIEPHEEKSVKTSVLVAVNSKRKNQHFLNNNSCSNSCTSKSLELSNNQLSILMDDNEANVLEDVDERRKSLICAAKATNLPKFKQKDLDLEDLNEMQVVSTNGNIDTKCAISSENFCKDIGLDAQEIELLDIEQKNQGLDSLSDEKEQKCVLSPKQQSNFPQYVIQHSDLQVEVDVLATKTSIYEDCKGNGGETFFAKSSEETRLGAHNVVAESTCESQRTYGLALLVMGEVDFHLSPLVVEMNNVEVEKLSEVVDSTTKQINIHNKRYPEQICRAVEFSYMKQLKKYKNLAPRDFVNASLIDVAFTKVLDNKTQDFGRDVSTAETPQCNKYNLREELGNEDVLISNDVATVPTTIEASCEDFKVENIGVEKATEGKKWYQQRLWCYLFENMKRAIDELYFLCELELDVEQIKEALLVLDEACVDFKDLEARVDDFNQTNEVPNLHQQSFATSTQEDLQRQQPQVLASEVCNMPCSQEQVNIISSSLETFKKVYGSPQSSSPQDRQQGDIFENLILQGPAPAQVVVSPKQTERLWKNASSISDSEESELLTDKSINSSKKILVPNLSSINRFMSPTASSEQRVFSREEQLNVSSTNSKSALEAWKEKKNWEDILSSPLSSSLQISRSLDVRQKSTKQVHMPYKKFESPTRKKEKFIETKKEIDEKQACTTSMPIELDKKKVQYLQKASKKSTRVSDRQAMRNNKLQRSMHSQQQSWESRHESQPVHISRRASDKSRKVNEVCFINSLHKKNKKLVLQQKLQDSKSRRIERLQTMRLKQKEDIANKEDAQEKRNHLEVERLQRIAEVQQKKDGTKVRQEEERKNVIATRETQSIEHVRKKEAWAKVQQDKDELFGKNLIERLRKNSLQQKIYLDQIKEHKIIDFDKQENCSKEILGESYFETQDQGSASCRQTSLSTEKNSFNQYLKSDVHTDVPLVKSTSGGSEQTSAGLISLVGNHNNTSLQAIKNKLK